MMPLGTVAQVQQVQAVGFTVSDMDQALQFYTQVLPFEKISDTEVAGEIYEKSEMLFGLRKRVVKLKLGDEVIELSDYLTVGGRPIPADSKSNDLWFQHIAIVVSDIDAAYQLLKKNKVMQVSTNPQTIPESNKTAAGVKAFYFRDPDGHNLELIYFPPDKGKAKWHNNQKLFLGIDHTAIGVANTQKSLRFYENILGLKVKGESYNTGTEQAHLNNVMGATLHISGLTAMAAGPGIEFLEYLAPGKGKQFPKDTRTDDLWYWQTTIEVMDIAKLLPVLKSQGVVFISEKIVNLPEWGNRKAFLVRDPDGHCVRLVD